MNIPNIESLNASYHPHGLEFEYVKSNYWILADHCGSWLPIRGFKTLSEAVDHADKMMRRAKRERRAKEWLEKNT